MGHAKGEPLESRIKLTVSATSRVGGVVQFMDAGASICYNLNVVIDHKSL